MMSGVTFEVIGEIDAIETIAAGPSVKVRSLLRELYGRGRWRKRKGIATVRLANGLQDQDLHRRAMKRLTKRFAVCLENDGNEASLIPGKIYQVIPDARAAKDDLVRIIDESGGDYLFSLGQFVLVDFPQAVRKKILALQRAS
jgi:hypothetical protein